MAYRNNQISHAAPPTLEQLQQQLAQANNATRNMGDYRGGSGAGLDAYQSQLMTNQNRAQQLAQQIQQMQNTSAAANDPAQRNRDELFGMARGAVTTKNPIDQQILAMLQERTGADAGPFNTETRNALMTQASDAAGQAMLNAKGRIHGSAGDPSVMAANNEADARRSQAIQQAQLGINTQANVANYDARGQALGQLGGYNQQVQHNQTDNERYLMDLLQRDTVRTQLPDTSGVPSFTQYSQTASAPRPASTPWQGFTGQTSGSSGLIVPHVLAPRTVSPTSTVPAPVQPSATAVRTVTPTVIRPDPTYQPYAGRSSLG